MKLIIYHCHHCHCLFQQAGIPEGNVEYGYFDAFQKIMPQNYRLIVGGKRLLYKGECGDVYICILLDNQRHYWAMSSLTSWVGYSYYCIECEVGYSTRNRQVCKKNSVCKRCLGKRCRSSPKAKEGIFCNGCTGIFGNSKCYKDHYVNKVCETASTCPNCGKWFSGDVKPHQCDVNKCLTCQKNHSINNPCFIETSKEKKSDSFHYIYYDFESYQTDTDPGSGRIIHKVNFCVAMELCHNCGDELCPRCVPVRVFRGLNGNNVVEDCMKWALSSDRHSATLIAYNSSGYDGHFILD